MAKFTTDTLQLKEALFLLCVLEVLCKILGVSYLI